MSDDQISSTLQQVLVEKLKVDESKVAPNADLFDDLGLDSIDLMTAVMAIEEKFGIEVSDAELEKVRTFGEAVSVLSGKVTAGA